MGWQDRDYAKWTDEERARHLGGAATGSRRRTEVTGLAILLSVVCTWGVVRFHVLRPGQPVLSPIPPALPAVVYGTGDGTLAGQETTCTALAADASGAESCTTWQLLGPGQHAVQAAPVAPIAGMRCVAVVANQETGRWTCTQGEPLAGSAGA